MSGLSEELTVLVAALRTEDLRMMITMALIEVALREERAVKEEAALLGEYLNIQLQEIAEQIDEMEPDLDRLQVSDRLRIGLAFRLLEHDGYTTREGGCCQACMIRGMGEEVNQWVFYTDKDSKAIDDEGFLTGPIFLSWAGDSAAIVATLREAGLAVFAPENGRERIEVYSANMVLH